MARSTEDNTYNLDHEYLVKSWPYIKNSANNLVLLSNFAVKSAKFPILNAIQKMHWHRTYRQDCFYTVLTAAMKDDIM